MEVKSKQLQILHDLLSTAGQTSYGTEHGFNEIRDYDDFCTHLPITLYEDIQQQVNLMKEGASDLLWPGPINKFAVSAGTTGKGKHLPLSSARLESDCRFMCSVASSYLSKWSRIPSIMGKHLSLPGSIETHGEFQLGEISGFTALKSPWWIRPFQLIPPHELIKIPFKEKFETVLNEALQADIRVIVAVPTWILTLFQRALQQTGKHKVSEIWPNLKLLVCGGVKLANYRPYLEKLYGSSQLRFIETYGSSEGYFAYSDQLDKNDLRFVYDNSIFYEFIPNPLRDIESLSIQTTVPLWEVEAGRPYAMLVTTNAGLWRYAVNDIVEFSSVNPPRIKVMGRLNEMLDDYGEAIHLYEAEQALNESCKEIGIEHSAFTVGATMDSERELPRHYWFIQFAEPSHKDSLERLARLLDKKLRTINRHYAIRRESGTLDLPAVHSISQKDINLWLEHHGKHKAQGKLPCLLQNKNAISFFRDKIQGQSLNPG